MFSRKKLDFPKETEKSGDRDDNPVRPVLPDKELGPLEIHVSHLPPELLVAVLGYLSVLDRCTATLVCTGWRDQAYHRSLWRDTKVNLKMLPENFELAFSSLTRRGIGHGRIYFNGTTAQNLSVRPLKQLSNLTKLELDCAQVVTDQNIELITQYLKKLVSLNLLGCDRLRNVSLRHIADGLPALKWLNVGNCWRLSDLGIGYLCGRGCYRSEELPVLEYLCLRGHRSHKITNAALLYLSEGQASLVELDLSYQILLTDNGMLHLAKMNKLTNLCLDDTNIGSDGMAFLVEGGTKVTKLRLANCRNLTNAGLEHVGRMTHLLDLNLNRCLISDDGLKLLAKLGSKIRILDLTNCRYITNNAMKHVGKLKDLQKLRFLGLFLGDDTVGDEGLGFLAAAGSQVAILYGNDMVTDVGLQYLAKLTNLHQLLLPFSKITPVGLVDFADSVAETLTHLDLIYCVRLNHRTLLYLAQRLFRLEKLKLESNHVDDEGKAAAARNLPRLRQLYVNRENIIDEVRMIGHLEVQESY